MKYYITYATNDWRKSQKLAEQKAYEFGADKVISYGPQDLDKDFVKKNIKILSHPRGGGYWLWKPYIILKTLEMMEEGDKVVYVDSGAHAIQDLNFLYKLLENKEVVVFELVDQINRWWTSKRCLERLNVYNDDFLNENQVCATYQLFKKTQKSVEFVQEYLKYCQIAEVVMDYHLGADSSYKEHRHDQSVISSLSYRHGIKKYRDPSQFGLPLFNKDSLYPQIFNQHRGNL